ncbi:hypothetical protein M514_10225 [Trichuris suis]|uniref:Uncharacterized protein n=1 Tax=Trichuris suis TaxID=68888 RepID=A0A085LV66_9BILA|nr:hypothetical protein M513_10225 [Trichuris suis]KFD66241.1 hypothetical protein M514_10225 [Trichuris suis]
MVMPLGWAEAFHMVGPRTLEEAVRVAVQAEARAKRRKQKLGTCSLVRQEESESDGSEYSANTAAIQRAQARSVQRSTGVTNVQAAEGRPDKTGTTLPNKCG